MVCLLFPYHLNNFFQDYEFFASNEADRVNNMAELDKLSELLELTSYVQSNLS